MKYAGNALVRKICQVMLFGLRVRQRKVGVSLKLETAVGQVVKTEASHAFSFGSKSGTGHHLFQKSACSKYAPLAQLVEQLTLNQWFRVRILKVHQKSSDSVCLRQIHEVENT